MTLTEMAQLLTLASVIDNRAVPTELVILWHKAVGYLTYQVAEEALNLHRQESTEYLLPAHIRALSFRVKEKLAVDRGPEFCPDHDGYPMPCHSCGISL